MSNRLIKSMISVVLVIMLCVVTIVSVGAVSNNNDTPRFVLTSRDVLIGDTFSVEVRVENNPGITALQLNVEYDEDYIQLTDIEHCLLFQIL